ncbi:MAG: DMT family transporter [Oscillospiraceae bacterium]|nr:DMT family transporter [Oscillospiraceae bacterium]
MIERIQGVVALLSATIIWGTAFVAQSMGMDHVGPFTFQAARCILAVISLILIGWLFQRKRYFAGWKDRKLWIAGGACGVALFFATSLQQVGLVYTDAGKGGFLTAMYIVLVPLFGVFLGKRPSRNAAISVIPAVIGLYCLSCVGVHGIQLGDLLMVGCAVCFAIQIILVDRFAQGMDPLRLNLIQSLVCAAGSLFFAWTEPLEPGAILRCSGAIVYTGVLSLGVAYSLQIVGQKRLEPTTASLLMSLESVFAVLGGWLILQERMDRWELVGCGLMLVAVIVSQLPERKHKSLHI